MPLWLKGRCRELVQWDLWVGQMRIYFSIFSICLPNGKSPKASNFALFSRSFYLWPRLLSVSPQRLRLLLPLLPSCPDLRCLSLSRSYQMLSDGTMGAPSKEHSDTICLSGKEVRHLPPPTLPFLFTHSFKSWNAFRETWSPVHVRGFGHFMQIWGIQKLISGWEN